MTDSAPMPLVNETTKRFHRRLQDAFPVSENRRASIELPDSRLVELPADGDRKPESLLLTIIIDAVCWGGAIALLVWMYRAGMGMPAPW